MKAALFAMMVLLTAATSHADIISRDQSWETDYTGTSDVYSLRQVDDNKLILGIDRNNCSLNQLGERSGCTRMAVFFSEHEAERLSVPANRRTAVYRLKGSSFGVVTVLKSIPGMPEPVKILKYDEQGNVVEAHRLQPAR